MGCRTYQGAIGITTLCWLTGLSCRIVHMQTLRPAILLHPPLHHLYMPHQLCMPFLYSHQTVSCCYLHLYKPLSSKKVRAALLQWLTGPCGEPFPALLLLLLVWDNS